MIREGLKANADVPALVALAKRLLNEKNKQLLGSGNKNEALKVLDELCTLDPKDYTSYLARGACYLSQDKWDEAIKDAKDAIAIDKKVVECYLSLAAALSSKGVSKELLEAVDGGLAIAPSNAQLLKYKSQAIVKLEANANAQYDQGSFAAASAGELYLAVYKSAPSLFKSYLNA